jgi:hypothetical protein
MKNYPNQASQFGRLRASLDLDAVRELAAEGQDPGKDSVLGVRFARRGIYTFRGLDFAAASPEQLSERIGEELAKPRSNRGMETCARELRRTLRDMGWLDSANELTGAGQELLDTTPGSLDERALLAEGLLSIAVADKVTGRTSHPVRVLLRLLSDSPSAHRGGLELALEAQDDSPEELSRVLDLYRLSPEERLTDCPWPCESPHWWPGVGPH